MIDSADKYFLDYQLRWLADQRRIKLWEKSRRIGATYTQAYEDVRDIVKKVIKKVWFSSADETAAKEYIEYCEFWTRVFDVAAKSVGYTVLEDEKDIKTLTIEFATGQKIHGLSSNPRAFRSKEGKIILDEFAHHDDPKKLWIAAKPCITWGYPLRILSTHNGAQNQFYKFVERAKRKAGDKNRLDWGLHTTPIQVAVDEGFADKILKRKLTLKERQDWLENERADCADDETWYQEYCCQALDEATAFLTYELIGKCEKSNLEMTLDNIQGDLYVGYDIARTKDLSVIWALERLGLHKYTRFFKVMKNTPFHVQREAFYALCEHPRFRRACIDQTGIGRQMAEEAARKFGQYRVEGVNFTSKSKEEMAYHMRNQFEDVLVHVPEEVGIREDLHSVKKVVTISGNIRFDVESEKKLDSHADRFWALALALHACADVQNHSVPKPRVRGRYMGDSLLRGF
jgi:phage FluMu gp28-like protein